MKNSIEIKKLSEEYWDKQPYNEDAFIAGYNKCLVDMGKRKMDFVKGLSTAKCLVMSDLTFHCSMDVTPGSCCVPQTGE